MPSSEKSKTRILIVEDELIIAQNIRFQLKKLGYAVTGITIDARETREALEKEIPDLVLMDIALYGGNDGVILAKWISKNYKIPVIYVTSHADAGTFERASKSMPYGYLIKPFNPKELYNSIELALQRHQLLMQLTSSSHLLGTVLQSITDAIIVSDRQENILYMNEAAETLLHTTYERVRKSTVSTLLPFKQPGSNNIPEQYDFKKIPSSGELSFESTLKVHSRSLYLQVRLSRLSTSDSSGVPEGFLIIMQDVTQRKKSENIILNIAGSLSGDIGEAFFQNLTQQLCETMEMDYCLLAEWNPDNNKFCQIQSAHSRVEPSLQSARLSISGTPVETAITSGQPVIQVKNIQKNYPHDRTLKELKIQGYASSPLNTTSGDLVGVLAVMTQKPLDQPEIMESVLRIFADRAAAEIERIRYEQSLISERNRANEMNALKNSFLSNMSHEVRTPLNSIMGFSALLQDEMTQPEHIEFLSFIEDGGKRLLQTINDLLDLSMLEANTDTGRMQMLDLEVETEEVVGMFKSQAQQKKLKLEYRALEQDIFIHADPKMTSQALRKLVDNAIKFTPEGSVTIEILKTAEKDQEFGSVRIKDTGVGISEEFMPQIFDEFKQESQGLGRKFEGVGLGLTIAKKITELMGGRIEVKSKKNKGSVFTLMLPIYQKR